MVQNQKINITAHPTGAGFDIQFLNGSISVPDAYGGYALSCGCGCGKTTGLTQFIVLKQDEGILYCVDTKSELEKMHQALLNNGILPDDMIMIHQDAAKDILSLYYSSPEKILGKKVVLITHCRLFADLINYFILYKPVLPIPTFDGDFSSLMQRSDIRKYILLDETPLFFKPFVTITRPALGNFVEKNNGVWHCKSVADMKEAYREFIENTNSDFFMANNYLNSLKKDIVFNLIPKYLRRWLNQSKKGNELTLNFYTADLVQRGMQAHVVVFEGAGDILLSSSTAFKLLDISQKYNTTVKFQQFPFPLIRQDANANITSTIAELANIINSTTNERYLIVVWKSIGSTNDEGAGVSEFRDRIWNELIASGIDAKRFEVTYYGAANTKSTNEFRDFENIILCGKWSISNDKAQQVCEAYMSKTTPEAQRLWYFVQLINRIAIRKHNGGTVRVWYSSDYAKTFIDKLDLYLNKNILPAIGFQVAWIEKAKKLKISQKQIRDIQILNVYDGNIGQSILGGRQYEVKITLDKLYSICKRSRKKRNGYKALKNKLALLGITLTIV